MEKIVRQRVYFQALDAVGGQPLVAEWASIGLDWSTFNDVAFNPADWFAAGVDGGDGSIKAPDNGHPTNWNPQGIALAILLRMLDHCMVRIGWVSTDIYNNNGPDGLELVTRGDVVYNYKVLETPNLSLISDSGEDAGITDLLQSPSSILWRKYNPQGVNTANNRRRRNIGRIFAPFVNHTVIYAASNTNPYRVLPGGQVSADATRVGDINAYLTEMQSEYAGPVVLTTQEPDGAPETVSVTYFFTVDGEVATQRRRLDRGSGGAFTPPVPPT